MRRFLIGYLAALAASGAWSAEMLASFSDAESDLSAAVRLEARTNATVAARVVTGTAPIVSSDGLSSSSWDTTQVANGWHEVTDAADAQKRVPPVKLLIVNEPDYQVEGGRIEKSTVWSPDKVHWVRNWVVVPNNVVLTVQAGTVVKFGENTGIKVEAGGEVEFAGKDEARVVLTHFADDDFGGDSDFGATNASYGAWSVMAVEGGTIKHIYTKMRYGTMQDTATVSLPASVTAQRIEGKVRIPVTFSGSRTSRFSLHWRATDGTAKFGTDYLLNAGETAWFNADDGKGYFEIPLVTESADTDVKTFLIDLYATEDANPNTSQLRTTVTIVTGTVCPVAVCAESELSPTARLEARDETTTGHALVRGMEKKSPTPDAQSEPWDTTKEPEGWNTLTVEDGSTNRSVKVLVRNASDIAFEGGRLSESVVWSNKETHIVRNWVVVPQNTRLLIAAGTVVKFAEHTGIRVEDGGTLQIDGKNDARFVLTALADDTFGGDTDCLETNAVFGTWGITTVGSGVVNDLYTHIRYGAPSTLPTISMPATVTCQRSEGKARIPVTFSGTRTSRFSIHWRAVEESAKKDEDFLQGEGEVAWFSTEGGAGAFEIPINTVTEAASNRTFTVEIFSAEDINVDTSRYATKVTIVTGSALPVATCAESEQSNLVRLEARETNTLGRAAVVGTEWKAKDDDSRAEAWDTTPLGYGWQTIEDGRGTNAQVLALNDAKIAVEGGRLTMNATWESNVVHVVRNTVVVPSGITLTVLTNAVVKFCENTGVKVEAGGSLIVVGSKDEPAIFTPLADDTTGGDTDKRETPVQDGQYAISVISGGTFSDSNAAFRHVVISSHATLSLPAKCEINESEKQVQIPISLSGSRTTPFRAFWRVIDGTAKYPDDFPIRTGVVEWNSSSDGTRYITVPVTDDGIEEDAENFTVELYEAQGANISVSACSCVVTVRDSTAAAVPLATCAESELSAAVRLENRPEGYVGKAVVCGVEQRAAGTNVQSVAWDTTTEDEGWQTLTASDAPEMTAQVLVRNDEKIAVEGGRLTVSTVWNSNTVHLVRNTVVVPSGVTLSVTTNAVVKFCENTGVKVEAGGRFQLLGSLDENVYMTLANDDTVGGDTDKDEEREWVEGAATYSINVVSGGTFTDMNSAIRGTTVGSFGYASVNAKTVVDATEGKVRIPVFVNGSRSTQFSVDWKTSDGLTGRIVWGAASEGTKWVTLNVADCSEKFTFELCECRGINIDGAAKASEVTVFNNATPLAVCAESESSTAVRLENRADGTFGKALCFGTEWKSADSESRAEAWDTTKEDDGWQGDLLVLNDASVAVEGGRVVESSIWSNDVVHVVRNWVVVPNGVTLTIAAGTVVKFAELTGFKVESGGRLNVEGTVDAPVVYTAAADDTIGGDTDKREVEPQYGDYSVNIVSGGTYSDKNCAIRYATFSNFGTATLPATAVANEKDGVVRVPMFISTSRTTAFCVDWRVASGSYATKGRLNWNTYTEGTKYIEIPLTPGTVKGEFDTFEIEMYESQGINVSTTERKCTVKVYPDNRITMAVCAESNASELTRLENRDPLWSYGAEIVCGTEWKSADGESRAEAWDTTHENEGWVEVTDGTDKIQLLVRNDEGLSIEGGRLAETTTWSKDKVHIVRNWVVVPSGVTLTIAAGTIVKFCDETGIKVEAGGRLVSAGTASADVILTSVNDDTVGGDTDFDEVEAEHGGYRINVISGGTFTDTYTQMRYGESGTFGSASAPAKVVAKKDGGIARIPITISTSRTTPFAVDWVTHDGSAVYGEDYLCASGRVEWTSSSQGTRYIEIPLDRLSPTAEDEWFEVELITGLGINLNLASTFCEVELYDTKDALVGGNDGYAESAWSDFTFVDGAAGDAPLFAKDNETITYSTKWREAGELATVYVQDAEENTKTFVETEGQKEGSFEWNATEYDEGRYTFTHKILNGEGETIKTDKSIFIINRDVTRHAGTLVSNEVWTAETIHLVMADVIVPSGLTLTIEPQTIVKFMPGTKIVVQTGATGICSGAIFTHAYDDTVGGDTFFDGAETSPKDGCYSLEGSWIADNTTEYRYSMPVEVGGTYSKDTHWVGYKTYIVTRDVTINNGATLTIDAGAILKFKGRYQMSVNSGATLLANGTRSAPIVFTSIKDDEHGGDTNGDGDATEPGYGDWLYVWVYGRADFNYTQLMYAAPGNERGIVMTSNGTLNMNGCVVAHAEYDGVWNWGGTIKVKNTVFFDCGNAACPYQGRSEYVNCAMLFCNYGFMDWSHWVGGTFKNCVFYGCGLGWSDTNKGPEFYSHSIIKNCCFYNPEEYSIQSCTKDGVDGCFYGDPGFVDAEILDLRIDEYSPCVDAGDGDVAPETDYYGQPRQSLPTVVPAGTPSANGKIPDIGIYEVLPRFVDADVDLELTSIVVPETLTVGQSATVSWSVKNIGSEYAVGQWVDKVELICANGSAVTLGIKLVSGGIAPGGVRTYSSTWTVPSAQEGAVRIRVTTNANRDLFEGSLMENNVGEAENQSNVLLPELELAAGGVIDLSVAADSDTAFRLGEKFADGGLIIVRSSGPISAWTGSGQVPTADIFYAGAVKVADGVYIVRVPATKDGYVAFANETTTGTKIEVEPEFGAFQLFDTGVVPAPNSGTATVTLFGNGFDEGVEVYLEGNGVSIKADDFAVEDGVKMTATFNVDGLASGNYSVRIVKEDEEVSGEVLSITNVKIGPRWTCKLETVSSIRSGRTYTGYFVYSNTGDVALDAPYVVIMATGETAIRFSNADAWTQTLELMATSETYPASKLKPGETVRIPFFYTTSGSSANIKYSYTLSDSSAFPWDTNGSYMRPSWANDEIWTRALATLKQNVGLTWNTYLARMRKNCDHLLKIGAPTRRLDRVWQLEINEALGIDHAVDVLANDTDLSRKGRGFGLSFTRSYGSGMHQRLRKGVLGYGWSDNLSISCELQENGMRFVIQSGNGGSYAFTKVSGNWMPDDARDKTRMTESSTEWTLVAQSGTVVKFSKSMKRFVSIRDNTGNGLDFLYDASGNVVEVKHTDGQWLRFTYEGGLLSSSTDDQGRMVSYTYADGLLTEVTAFNGCKVKYNYLPTDETATSRALRQIVAPDGQTKDFTYDAEGRVATVSRNGMYFTSEIVRGKLGSYSIVASNGGVTEVTVGASGEALATVNALGQKVQRTYTADALLDSVIAPSGKRSKIVYDSDGQAVKSMDAAGAVTSFAYTEDLGLLKSVTDARQNAITYGYDKFGRSESVTYSDETSSCISYAANGDVSSAVNAKGESIVYEYDREGNKVRTVWPNGRTFVWAYDAKGCCTNASDTVTGVVTMEYDDQERLTRIVYPSNRGFTYAYDAYGRVTARTSFDGAVQKYEYDAFGRLAKMTDDAGKPYVVNTYDPQTGNLILQTFGNGTVVSNDYDLLDRMVSITHRKADGTVLESFAYAYNEDGQRISLTTKEGVERYAYDAAGQVVAVIYPDGTEENFTYDAVGNRLTTDAAVYAVNALNQYTRIEKDGATSTLTYDLDGNLTRVETQDDLAEYFYDCENRLIGVTNTLKGIAWSCEYDVFGNRVRVTDNGVTTEKLYVQGSLPSVVAEYRNGALVTRHILSGAVRIADVCGEGDSRPLVKEGDIHYYHADGLASTRLLTDASGSVVAAASYKVFGTIRTKSGHAITDGYVGTLGVECDTMGLLFMRNRYYDSLKGRFVQRDPIGGNAGDVNWYRYCQNNTVGEIDPDGYFSVWIGCKEFEWKWRKNDDNDRYGYLHIRGDFKCPNTKPPESKFDKHSEWEHKVFNRHNSNDEQELTEWGDWNVNRMKNYGLNDKVQSTVDSFFCANPNQERFNACMERKWRNRMDKEYAEYYRDSH